MVTLDSFLLEKYQLGMIAQEEVITKAQDPSTIMIKLQELEAGRAAAEGQKKWVDEVYERGGKTIDFAMNCTPGYYNNEGNVSPTARQDNFYFGDDPHDYTRILEEWRASGEMPGMLKS